MKIKKTHIPVILAGILLILLVGALIYVIFFMKDSNRIKDNYYAKKINDYKMEVQVVSYNEGDSVVDLEHMDYQEIKVNNYVNNQLVDNEIFSGSIKVVSQDDGFILYSYSNDSFIMKTDLNFKTKWIYKPSKDGYQIKTILVKSNKIYAILSNDNNVYGTTFDLKGKKSKYVEITNIDKYNSVDVVAFDDSFIMYSEKSPVINFNKIDLDFKLEGNSLNLVEKHSDLIGSNVMIQGMTSKNNKAYYFIQSFYRGGTNNIIGIIDNNLNEVSFKNINDVFANKLSASLFNNNVYINDGNKVVIYNADTGVKTERDFSSMVSEDDPMMIYVYGDSKQEILYTNVGNSYVIDVYEENKLKKTMVINLDNEQIKGVPLYALSQDNKLYVLSSANNYSLYLNKYEF